MPKRNAYFIFLLEIKRKEEKERGQPVKMDEISEKVSLLWEQMDAEEKAKYKEKAKGAHGSQRNVSAQPRAQENVACARQKKKIMFEQHVDQRIDKMLENIPIETDFVSFPIFLMCGNYFYRNMDGDYSPAEIALIKFTFEDGIAASLRYSAILNPGRPQLGYAAEAKKHSELTHFIPVPFTLSDNFGERDLNRVHYTILKMLKEEGQIFDGGKPLVFTYSDPYSTEYSQIDILKSIMTTLSPENRLEIDIFPLERLFVKLRSKLVEMDRIGPLPNDNFANVIMCRDPFDATRGISCEYHEETERSRHCALSFVTRWAFMLADNFCELLGVRLRAGKHLPKDFVYSRTIGFNDVSMGTFSASQSYQSTSISTLDTLGASSVTEFSKT